MTIYSFKEFIGNIILESLHPEIEEIVKSPNVASKKLKITKKVKEIVERGEKTGIEGNMPEGSSRAYIPHEEKHQIVLDGNPTSIKTGTKIAIRSKLDRYHDGEQKLGNMQNRAENGDWYVNNEFRIITEDKENKDHYHTNTERGIFPPLVEHDGENDEWSHVGHVRNTTTREFKKLTKTPDFPNGISHEDFSSAIQRMHLKWKGLYWKGSPERENHYDNISNHPLVQKFVEYHMLYDFPPGDYGNIKNMGVWEHPDGSKHIVARDHGFNNEVSEAYLNAKARLTNKRMFGH